MPVYQQFRTLGGPTLDVALKNVQFYNSKGLTASLSFLPLNHHRPEAIQRDIVQYEQVFVEIDRLGLQCDATLKLIQLGLSINYETAAQNVRHLINVAKQYDVFVWVDMELPNTVDDTIKIFQEAHQQYVKTGLCLQACLNRTDADMQAVLEHTVPLRLVKGFYRSYDIRSWDEVGQSYARLMEYTLFHSNRPAIATHDPVLVEQAAAFIKKHNIGNAEFQFFMGVNDALAFKLAEQGFRVCMYIPFGKIFRYFMEGVWTFDMYRNAQRLLGFKKIY